MCHLEQLITLNIETKVNSNLWLNLLLETTSNNLNTNVVLGEIVVVMKLKSLFLTFALHPTRKDFQQNSWTTFPVSKIGLLVCGGKHDLILFNDGANKDIDQEKKGKRKKKKIFSYKIFSQDWSWIVPQLQKGPPCFPDTVDTMKSPKN